MSSVVSLHIGGAGIKVGDAIWNNFAEEHNLWKDGRSEFDYLENSSSFFDHKNGVAVPRCVMTDTNPFIIDQTKRNGLYSPHSFVHTKYDTGGIFPRGMYGHKLLEQTVDQIRKTIENYDNHQFMLYHSLGGGTGSGFTSLLLEALEDFEGGITNVSILPSLLSASSVEFYNMLLGINHLLKHSGGVLLLDNTALTDNTQINFREIQPTPEMINKPIQQILSAMTYSLRFSGENQITGISPPYPSMMFHFASCYPFGLTHTSSSNNNAFFPQIEQSIPEIAQRLYHPHSTTTRLHPKRGRYASTHLMFRGDNLQVAECQNSVAELNRRKFIRFVDWSPVGFKYHVQKKFPNAHPLASATMVGNSSEFSKVFTPYIAKVKMLLAKKAFLHWYKQAGCEEDLFGEAMEELEMSIQCYQEIDENFEEE